MTSTTECPFRVGELVEFTPSTRTLGLYQDLARFGLQPGDIMEVVEVREGIYLYGPDGAGGWPWTEFKVK